MKITINSKEINLNDRQETTTYFGTWFKKNGSPDYFIERCRSEIAINKMYIENLEKLMEQKQKEKDKEQAKEFKEYFNRLSPEEKEKFINS